MREKKVDNIQLFWRILEIVKRKETFMKMAANNVEAGFHLHSSGVYEDFIKNFIRQYHHQQQQQENINQQQKQNINRIHIRGCFLKYIGIDLY